MANTAATVKPDTKIKKRGKKTTPGAEVWHRIRSRPLAMISLICVLIIVVLAIFADLITPYTNAITQVPKDKLLSPCAEHIFGTDNFGRDMFARIIHGARVALLVGIVASGASLVLAIILACFCSLFGGKVDMIIMRCIDILHSIPGLVVSLAICAGLGNGLWQLIVALAVSNLSLHVKMIRSQAITLSKMEYIESATALGGGTGHIIVKHLTPNLASVIIINGTASVAMNIMSCATLSFIGLGIKAPQPEWGLMLSSSLSYMARYPYMVFIPGLAILFTALSINTFGDCLRDAFDPQLKGKA